jgi:hypothetical protein
MNVAIFAQAAPPGVLILQQWSVIPHPRLQSGRVFVSLKEPQ